MRKREDLEKVEEHVLAPYACKSGNSKGRLFPEDEHNYRTCFQRDKDRIIHTSAFRRLEYKTQVFVNHEGDYYRTRLTHTLEVTQIAKTIARTMGVNEDLVHAISLAHDLGHTPFGHSGQDVMGDLMESYGGFEHNQQSFRIVTYLESYYPKFTGLNLSREVLEGMMKHTKTYALPDGSQFTKQGAPTIEAQICNIADAIAYNNHDIDDGLKSGLLALEDLETIEIWKKHYEITLKNYPDFPQDKQVRITVRRIIDEMVTDLVQTTTQEINDRSIQSLDDVYQNGQGLVRFSEEIQNELYNLQQCLFANLYRHYRVERMAAKAKRVIEELFKAYTENPNTIPKSYKKKYIGAETHERMICDYIAGMTDRFALEEYSKLFDPFSKV